MQQLVEQDSQGPYVHMVVILCLEEHFRSHVLVCATKGRSFDMNVMSCPP
jgi:hypothetical protein